MEPGSPQNPPPHACCELAAVPLLLPKKFPLGSLGEISAQAQLLTTARPPLAPGAGLHGGGWGLPHGTPPPEHPWAGETPGGRIWGQDLGAAARGLQEGSKAPPATRTSERSPKKLPGRGGIKGGEKGQKEEEGGRGGKSCSLCLVSSPSAVTQPPNSPSSCHSEAGGDYAEALSRIDSCGTRA